MGAALALNIRAESASTIGTFIPLESEPGKVFVNCLHKLRFTSGSVQILDSQQQSPVRRASTLLGGAESHGMAKVEKPGG